MASTNYQFPVRGKIKADGTSVRVVGETRVAGIRCYELETPRGKPLGTYHIDAVVVYGREPV